MKNNPTSKPTLASGVTLTEVSDKTVLFSTKTGDSFGLNETAAHMLKLCLSDGVEEAVNLLSKQFDAPAEEIAQDLQELLEGLRQAGLIE
ncbi:PqqD family protein [Orrella sp. 11846]|uniref:PqqD family protein n=1 Tax=Orrella sp. 11846 TaxID=3409913 RepID=UPI003B592234